MKIEAYSPTIRRKEMAAVLTAMVEDKIGPGEQAKILIQTAKERIKFDYCLALRSPAIALYLALKALGLQRGQGVVVSALSPLYYAHVIEDMGLVAVYCDVLPSSACIGRETVEKAISSVHLDVRCLALHHTLGYIPDREALAGLGLPIIEDNSESYGTAAGEDFISDEEGAAQVPDNATAGSRIIGSVGVFTILGLEERDMLTSGGGALLYSVNRRDSSLLRNLGLPSGDLPPQYGLPDMNAALAVVQFREITKNLQKRSEFARLYTQSAMKTRHKRFVQYNAEYNNYVFPLILETGLNDVKVYARRKDVAVESAFDNTLAGTGIVPRDKCPEAYSLSLRTVLFPLYPRLGMTNALKVAKLIQTLP